MRSRLPIVAAPLLLPCLACPGVADAAFLRTQNPCTANTCVQIAPGAKDLILRSFKFNAPGRGSLEITFHGSLFCDNNNGARAVVDLNTQIVLNENAAVDPGGAGGLRLAAVIEPDDGIGYDSAEAYNLASKRVVDIAAAGERTVYLKVHRSRVDPGTRCYSFNDSFSVMFLAAGDSAKLFSGKPCNDDGHCARFTRKSIIPAPSIRFRAPAKGSALVSVNGSLYCANLNGGRKLAAADIQITDSVADDPRPDRPGGLRYQLIIPDAGGAGMSDAVNVMASRLFSIPKAGDRTYSVLVRPAGMDTGVVCYLYSMTLTALFTPASGPVKVVGQPVCDSDRIYCRKLPIFNAVKAREIEVAANGPGRFHLQFRATVVCSNPAAERRTINVDARIADARFKPGMFPEEPGTLVQLERFDANTGAPGSVEIFNLAASFVDEVTKASTKRYAGWVNVGDIWREADCKLYNGMLFSTFVAN